MNFFSLALNNIKKKFGSYLIYLISTTFAVTIFFIFSSIYYNPQFSVYRFGTGKMSVLFKVSAIAVILFSSVFVVYANKFFVKTRKKEIAIYSLLGMKQKQIGRMLFYENILMGILAIAGGVLFGSIFSRFFCMILFTLMAVGTKVTFSISPQAIITTTAAFFILFIINSLNAYSIIYRYKLIELLTANKEGEKAPRYSIAGGILSIIMLIAGYIISMAMDVNKGGFKLLLPSLIIILLIMTGTLFFFKNFIPMMVVKLKSNKHFYYKPDNFISMSQIVYRIKANSRMFTIIAILSAITVTIMSSTYSMYKGLESTPSLYSPFSLISSNVSNEQYNSAVKTIEKINEVKLLSVNRFNVIKVKGQNPEYTLENINQPGKSFNAYILSQSDYKSIIKNTHVKKGHFNSTKTDFNMDLKDGECYFIDGNSDKKYCENLSGNIVKVNYLEKTINYKIAGVSMHKYLGIFNKKTTFVLNDKTFNDYYKSSSKDNIVSFIGLMFDKPLKSQKTVNALNNIFPINVKVFRGTGMKNINYIGFYKSIFSLYGAYVFIGMFLGILFLLASGSIMYYKQIIEAQEEVLRYDILRKTGMKLKEIRYSVSKQLAIAFGMPMFIGLIHSCFAIFTFSRAMDPSGETTAVNLSNAFMVMGIYIIIYCFYYVLSINRYMSIISSKKRYN